MTAERELLELIGLVGELPLDSLKNVRRNSDYIKKIVRRLKKEERIVVYTKDKIKALRLSKGSIKKLMEINSNRFERLDKESIFRSDLQKRLRIHRTAEVSLLMLNSGVNVYKNDKPIILKKIDSIENIVGKNFYNSTELKRVLSDRFTTISSSRFIGILPTQNELCILYNCDDKLMRWAKSSEDKAYTFFEYFIGNRYKDRVTRLMIGRTMEFALKLISTIESRPSNNGIYLSLDYDNFYYAPNNEYGEIVIRLISDNDKYKKLVEVTTRGMESTGSLQELSEYTQDKVPVLLMFKFDMIKLVKFVYGLKTRNIKGKILCLDFQQEVIRNYCGDIVEVEALSSEKLKGAILYV